MGTGKFGSEDVQNWVRRMTNWQRNQWARAKYPTDQESLAHFSKLVRWTPAMSAAASIFGYERPEHLVKRGWDE